MHQKRINILFIGFSLCASMTSWAKEIPDTLHCKKISCKDLPGEITTCQQLEELLILSSLSQHPEQIKMRAPRKPGSDLGELKFSEDKAKTFLEFGGGAFLSEFTFLTEDLYSLQAGSTQPVTAIYVDRYFSQNEEYILIEAQFECRS